ncbi:hypothetical protein EVAR_10164_1 [Eumeta japonica]|uniref:Uncharacterized protein n=1 Tax=Eumeta variegata TaxID=151549 RepID=A0A4C1TD76_EUMVA|nr:hypothetical protein EVAR_10164_1 [Eumeta japonica]
MRTDETNSGTMSGSGSRRPNWWHTKKGPRFKHRKPMRACMKSLIDVSEAREICEGRTMWKSSLCLGNRPGSEAKSFIRKLSRRLRDKGGEALLGLIYSKPYLLPSNAAMWLV